MPIVVLKILAQTHGGTSRFISLQHWAIAPSEKCLTYGCYILHNYISKDADSPSPFSLDMRVEFQSTERYTINAMESFHNYFNKNFYITHPDV